MFVIFACFNSCVIFVQLRLIWGSTCHPEIEQLILHELCICSANDLWISEWWWLQREHTMQTSYAICFTLLFIVILFLILLTGSLNLLRKYSLDTRWFYWNVGTSNKHQSFESKMLNDMWCVLLSLLWDVRERNSIPIVFHIYMFYSLLRHLFWNFV